MGLKSAAVQLGQVHQACAVHHGESTESLGRALGSSENAFIPFHYVLLSVCCDGIRKST